MLYRRWKTREDLLRATVRHCGGADAPPAPDTGTLRGDLLALLTNANGDHNPMAALVSSMLGSYYNKTGPTPVSYAPNSWADAALLSNRSSTVPSSEEKSTRPGSPRGSSISPSISSATK